MSRLEKFDILESLYEDSIELQLENIVTKTFLSVSHHILLVEMSNEFKQRLKQVYSNDEY